MLFRLSNISKSYGGNAILRDVAFQVNPGEKIGLVGRNGAGKTTLFNLLTGREAPDTGEIVKMRGLKLGLLEQHVDFAGKETVHTAALSAFQHIHDIENEMRLLEKQMETDHSEPVLERYAELQTAFEQADGFTYTARAEAILQGVGFSSDQWNLETRTLSGGQKNRLGMARLLLSNSDVLLLDEPTNHLDVDAVEWLEEYLTNYATAYVIISHDRYFLDRTTDRIIELENGRAVSYKGNYSKFLVERELRREQQQREYENQRSMIAKTEEFIRRNLEGQKTKQAKSRRNMLERLDRIEAVRSEKSGGNFKLKNVERAGNNVLTTEELAIGYASRTLASGLNISLHRGGALGIIGGNGTGKTTLLKTLIGEIRELGGKLTWGTKTNIGYYSQNLDDLHEGNDILSELRRVAPMVENVELRSFLARFLFFGEDVEKRVRDLSGGEKGRLALAKLIYSQKNVLILDEPTNHLDIPAREALEAALDEYPGTIITVSHDRYFLDRIATQMLSFEADGTILEYSGNYSEFHDWKAARVRSQETDLVEVKQAAVSAADEQTTSPSAAANLSKNQLQRIEKRIKELEAAEIPKAEAETSRLQTEMSDAAVVSDPERLRKLAEDLNATEARVKALYAEWEDLLEQLK
ncbi:MAG: ABC-F family ATP-binding cassette domain-containing protein [Acidobacteria bacterium]|nr:ABC-F family ATP-binding cassette domain-containing protein [Acidobacteriota bacterium]